MRWLAAPMAERYVWAVIAVLSAALTMKYFPGLENETAYAGNVFQVLNPWAFTGDPYRGAEVPPLARPLQLSLFYLIVKLTGSFWLDDRFVALVYLGIVVAGLAAVDRIARLFGAKTLTERALVLMFFAKDHQLLATKVLLSHHDDFNHTAIARPIVMWLLWAALARKGLVWVLGLGMLLAAFSVRSAAVPLFFALAIVAVTGSPPQRRVVLGLGLVGLAAAALVVALGLPVPEADRLELWHFFIRQEGDDANPFVAFLPMPAFMATTLAWFAVLIGAMLVARPATPEILGLRTLMVAGMVVWLGAGLYLSFAPDPLKVPLLVGFAPNRATCWPQNIAYIVLVLAALRALRRTPDLRIQAVVTLGLIALFAAGPGNLLQWVGLAAIALLAVTVVTLSPLGGRFAVLPKAQGWRGLPDIWPRVVVLAFALVLVVAYGVAVRQKLPHWQTAWQTGVHGWTASAKWIGIAEYFRDNTPRTTSVLTLEWLEPDGDGGTRKLRSYRGLATRSGRPLATPEVYGGNFRDPASWRRYHRQRALLLDLGDSLLAGDTAGAERLLDGLALVPDYLVLPADVWRHVEGKPFRYGFDRAIGDYALLRRAPPAPEVSK